MKKHLLPIGLLFIVVNSFAQTIPSSNENYIYTKTYISKPGDPVQKLPLESITYFDGLGRPKQILNVKSSPAGNDVVTKIEYDGFGRQTKNYLPVPQQGSSNGAIYGNPLINVTSTPYGSEKIYSDKVLENSPLDRIQQQVQVGNDWSNKPVNFAYGTNTATEVKKFITTTSWTNNATNSTLTQSGNFGASQLYKNIVTDEDGNVSVEFKNGEGQTLLVRKNDGTKDSDTYYIYNEVNQLAFVIQPEASAKASLSQSDVDELCFQYRYDGRNRLVEKKIPGKGWEYLVYDNQDRLVMTQDANLLTLGQWLFTKYDKFGRVAYTGITTDSNSRSGLQTIFNGKGSNNVERTTTNFAQSGLLVYYDNDAAKNYPNAITKLLSVNYFDIYPAGAPTIPTSILSQGVLPQTGSISTKSLPTASYVNNVEADGWTKNYIWYDSKGRTIGTHSINHLGGYTKMESELDFAGVVKQQKTYHKRLSTDQEKVISEVFTYDTQNRLKSHTHQVDNANPEMLVQNEYNELSQLKQKKVGGTITTPLQTIDYTYNIRGWLTGINDPNNLSNDLFGYKIKYNQVEGLSIPDATDTSLQVLPKYNGNIAEIDWKTAVQQNEPLKRYGYVYDNLNRLKAGFYQKSTNPSGREYFEKLKYDLNGNITELKRTSQAYGPNTIVIDNLSYQYNAGGFSNKLQKITDTSQNSLGYPYKLNPTDVGYDNNGNMVSFTDKGISSIQYNYLNLPKQITQNAQTTNYTYRADGVKVKKLFGTVETNYLDGFQYKYTEPWDDPSGNMQNAATVLRMIPTSEGYFDALLNKYFYNYTDHLGNVRLTYSDHDGDGVVTGDIVVTSCQTFPDGTQACNSYITSGGIEGSNDYYPFGLMHNSQYYNHDNIYKYKYQGQELQETGWYSFKWRNYMPDVGRFFNIDPLSEKYAYQSHYNFSENKVVAHRELEGLEAVKVNKDTPFLVITVNGRAGGGSGDYIQGNNTLVKNLPAPYNKGDDGLSLIGKNPLFPVNNATVVNYAGSDSDITAKHIAKTISDYHNSNPDGKIALIGHSLGGKNVLEAANIAKDVPINLVMTLEAATPEGGMLGSAYSSSLGSNVKNIINFNSNRSSYIGSGGTATSSTQNSTKISLPTGTDHTNMDNSLIFYIAPLLNTMNTANPVNTVNNINFNNMTIFNNGQVVPDPNNKKGTSSY